ncbi:hypothetical protein EC917_1553 [Bacillus thuringiensis]|uniref:Uncharacterized protein n=1 Tax=Bacillus thuringiensis TaxID=1428 RepID=A0A4R4AVT6_BACTU|nr:hypothetical protein [Bacillus thuringiensis]TCW42853.1 hypothetical protein EC917_1553 [Bacillus thuringiensis]TCW43359.1 hypothetical protein EC910_1543 [Bacillus thuringiensis]
MKKKRYIRGTHSASSTKKDSIFNFSDMTIYISLITALGYFISYSYKKGYRSYYGLNEVLINQIDLSSILLSITLIVSVLFTFLGIYNNIRLLLFNNENIYLKILERKVFAIFLLYFIFNYLNNDKMNLMFSSIVLLIWIIIVYSVPLFVHRDIKGYRNKLVKSLKKKKSNKSILEKTIYIMKNDLKSAIVLIFVVFFTFITFSGLLGVSHAKKQKDYYILKHQNKIYVVVDSYSDKVIIAPIDLKTNTIEKKFQIIESKSSLKEPILFEKIRINDGIKY